MVAMETKLGRNYCAISDFDIFSSRTCRILSMVIKVVPFEGANKGLQTPNSACPGTENVKITDCAF